MSIRNTVAKKVFEKIHLGNLVYNTCWEDPRCDRQMMKLNNDSRVVMLTSAGCNALDYLLDDPAAIHCVDVNPRQNALLHFKTALFKSGSHRDLFAFFGEGSYPDARAFYADTLKQAIPEGFPQQFWNQSVGRLFSGKGIRKSFYWHGSSGTVAWMLRQWMRSRPETEKLVLRLFESSSLSEQEMWYEQLEKKLMGPFFRWFVRQHVVQSMLGVPKSQQIMARERYQDGLAEYVRVSMRKVFTEVPVQDNYFWKLYFLGQYQPDCCPNYLRPQHFNTVESRVGRLSAHTMTLSSFLVENPGRYTHFVLLDHQDWLASHDRNALDEEWQLIFGNSAPGAKVLFRSAAPDAGFLPAWVSERLDFQEKAAEEAQLTDRVGTYASTHFATILS